MFHIHVHSILSGHCSTTVNSLVTVPLEEQEGVLLTRSLSRCLFMCKDRLNCFSVVYDRKSRQCRFYKETIAGLNVTTNANIDTMESSVVAGALDVEVRRWVQVGVKTVPLTSLPPNTDYIVRANKFIHRCLHYHQKIMLTHIRAFSPTDLSISHITQPFSCYELHKGHFRIVNLASIQL